MAVNYSKGFPESRKLASTSQTSAYERVEPRNFLHLRLPAHRVQRYSNARPEERLFDF